MSSRPIAFDLTRLITRLRHASPTGIDRVDLAYARHVLAGDGPRFGLVTSAVGPRVIDRRQASTIVEAVASGWVEDVRPEDDPVYLRLAGSPGERRPGAEGARRSALRRRQIQVATTLRTLRGRGVEALPEGTIYLHSSHLRLDRPERFDWLYTRRDIRPIFFVHDLIPISHPEYGRPGEAARHEQRIDTIARHAAAVIVNSSDVGARFSAHLAARGFAPRAVTVAPLGVEPIFSGRDGAAPAFGQPTFLVCGTIESRKNHLLLLQVWRDLAARHGAQTPRLVIVGRRGWEVENVVDLLDRCPSIAPHVTEVSGLSTPGLARLMRGATALLMPSFIEGYGLPVVEAAASGLPVVVSDIPVHREIGGGFAKLIDPLDGPGWRQAIEDLSAPESSLRHSLAARLDGFAPPNWADHLVKLDTTLAALDQT
ncbi:glycosyltransferase family 4 protein [Methylobacterium brachythecii]|uniref:Capsular polysaccharide glycosyltransferase biosynthesis protein n=1 Tax=Methylobacterium brachythecii TaxID=1176177 RepID=A0A7W6F8I0_9HYPH|nr:glycosyltransferase family 1 protein [Methylobacterium brachythecii]MBB3904552.1 glycosyltransferase involved in cell wall biosynthesis [Methylobacterium brachythecii]GLS46383.1 capsular polysaccharide glycosyltransferase biosynthesis protein [Methylobacterium brachythecii]